jgi:hypothetical protein
MTDHGSGTRQHTYLPDITDRATAWAAYTEASGKIAEILEYERSRSDQHAADSRQAKAALGQLDVRVAAQRQHLTELSTSLRLPAPHLSGIAASAVPDPAEALRQAVAALDTADQAAQAAHRQAAQPPLLPGVTPLARNALVYGAAAFLGAIVTMLIFVTSDTDFGAIPWQLLPWSLCGLPAISFIAGFVTISLIGQPRIGGGGTKSTKVGGIICFVGMPILWFMFLAATRG